MILLFFNTKTLYPSLIISFQLIFRYSEGMIQKYEKYLYCFELKNAFLNQKKFEIFFDFSGRQR